MTEKLAALLGVPVPGVLPPLWHEVHLRDAVGPRELGPDGHPREGALLPPVEGRRRLFEGSTVEHTAPLVVGDVATRDSTVVDARARQGRSGPLLLVTEEHRWTVGGQERLRERRDIIYRQGVDPAVPERGPLVAGALVPDERYLFAYSALTYNPHRILPVRRRRGGGRRGDERWSRVRADERDAVRGLDVARSVVAGAGR